jgi:hypothetical protein
MVSAVNWGPVSEWVSGVATLLAVGVALVFPLRLEREQRNAKYAAVFAWFEVTRSEDGDPIGTLWVTNNTDFPIYEWTVTALWPSVGARDRSTVTTGHTDHGLLPPGRHDFVFSGGPDFDLPTNDAEVKVDISFRDASGRQRRRFATGLLS